MNFETNTSFDNNAVMNLNIACCLCVRDNSHFLPSIFENLTLLSKHFKNFTVIFVHDNCSDNSESLLLEFLQKSSFLVYVIHNTNNNSHSRTARIANSRNVCLDLVYNRIANIDFHFMIDADNVNVPSWNISLIKRSLLRNDWDALSFNRPNSYYDIWALVYGHFKHHCWGFDSYENNIKVVRFVEKDIIERLDLIQDDELFVCDSAFNGFSIYRTPVFKDCKYDGLYQNCKGFLSDEDRYNTIQYLSPYINNLSINDSHEEICEHVFFHMSASMNNGARIRISKEFIMDSYIS